MDTKRLKRSPKSRQTSIFNAAIAGHVVAAGLAFGIIFSETGTAQTNVAPRPPAFNHPTYSSPIAMSVDNRLV